MREILLLNVLVIVGCGGGTPRDQPETGEVHGVIRLDGEAVEGVSVRFTPESGGRPSSGQTNADGEYSLVYTASVSGAKIGPHSVSLSMAGAEDDDGKVEELLPARYNTETTLKENVEAGTNDIPFDLVSDP